MAEDSRNGEGEGLARDDHHSMLKPCTVKAYEVLPVVMIPNTY